MSSPRNFACVAFVIWLGVSLGTGQTGGTPGNPEVWGGQHVSMVMSEKNVTLEFDCAEGVILNPIAPDANGNFTAEGTYTPQRGGPVKKDAPPQDLPATYKGTIHGDTMHLEVILADKQQQLPSLTLTRNQAGRIVKCH
jgi:hypothetical protein